MVTKGPLESPNGLFWKTQRHALRKTSVKYSFSVVLSSAGICLPKTFRRGKKTFYFSVFQLLLLNASSTYSDSENSECYLSKETKTMHVLQMVQEQHSIYFG